MLSQDHIIAIRNSWSRVAADRQRAGALFYSTLFRLAPDVRPLFPAEMRGQELKLVNTLGVVVDSLHSLEDILSEVESLGVSHRGYGAEPAHYAVVGEALIATLQEALGDEFTADTREAWTRAYSTLSAAMIAAAEREV